jgi:predicted ATPase
MRISQIEVTKLFGTFTHVININFDERITIIHGPNGVGKTTLLRLVNAVFNKQGDELRSIPFEELIITFDDKSILKIVKKISKKEEPWIIEGEIDRSTKEIGQFNFKYEKLGQKPLKENTRLHYDPRENRLPLSFIERIIPNIERIGVREWIDSNTGEIYSYESLRNKYGHLLPLEFRNDQSGWPKWFDENLGAISVRFVRAQRLLLLSGDSSSSRYRPSIEKNRGPQVSEAVLNYASQLRDTIRQRLAEFSILSQSLDRTFPQKVIDSSKMYEMIPPEELVERLSNLDKKRKFLINVGLYDPSLVSIPLPDVNDPHIQSVLSVYVKTEEEKLVIFDELAGKIDLLVKLINSRFMYKKMIIDKDKGFVFETEQGILSPANLSSGEQHELVLIYELLFQTKKGTLVLIDEPELSFHVGWQISFLKDLKQIIDLTQIDALVATHSPQIVNNRWDLTTKLGGES